MNTAMTKIDIQDCNKQIRLFAKVDYEIKIEILTMQKSLFHKLKYQNKEQSNAILTLESLILSIKKVTSSLDDIAVRSIIMKGTNLKNKVKQEKLLSYWAILKTLRERENMSFRKISEYFNKYHKFEISYSSIQKTWNKIEKEGIKNG